MDRSLPIVLFGIGVFMGLVSQAQLDDHYLFDFDTAKYRSTADQADGEIKIVLERYGDEFQRQQKYLRNIEERLANGSFFRDLTEWEAVGTKEGVHPLIGYVAGVDDARFDSLYAKVTLPRELTAGDSAAMRELVDSLKQLVENKTKALDGRQTGLKELRGGTDSLVVLLIADIVSDTNALWASVRSLGLEDTIRSCNAEAEKNRKQCVQSLLDEQLEVVERHRTELRQAMDILDKGGKSMLLAYADRVLGRRAEIEKIYTRAKLDWKKARIACADSLANACTDVLKEFRQKLHEAIDSTRREFTVRQPISEHAELFKDLFAEELIMLSGESDKREEAKRVAEANLWRLIALLALSPTPDAGELCVNRELMVNRRKTPYHIWLESRLRYRAKKRNDIFIYPMRSFVKRDAVIGDIVKDALDGKRITQPRKDSVITYLREHKGLRARYVWDVDTEQDVLAIIGRRKYDKLHTARRLRHHVLSRPKALWAIPRDKHRFHADVQHIKVKFEDGVIDEIVVVADVQTIDQYRVRTLNGRLADSTWVYYRKVDGDTGQYAYRSYVQTKRYVFTNSNTPIPFSNVWNYYERFMDRMPLYGYSKDPGPQYKGTAEPDMVMTLSDLLLYVPELNLHTNNMAPGDTVIEIDFRPPSDVVDPSDRLLRTSRPAFITIEDSTRAERADQICAGLKKDDLRKVGEFRVYSDLVGLAKDRPNGLLQAEYAWRVPLWPKKNQGVNFLTWVEPMVTYALLQEEEKRLYIGIDDGTTNEERTTFPVDLIANATYSTGLKLNPVHLSLRYVKSELELNFLGYYLRTALRDSVQSSSFDSLIVETPTDTTITVTETTSLTSRELEGIGSFLYGAEIRWKVRPDSRFGFDVFGGMAHFTLMDRALRRNDLGPDEPKYSGTNLLFVGLEAHLFASPKQKLFFRSRLIADLQEGDQHMFMLQVGYNRNLRLVSPSPPKPKVL